MMVMATSITRFNSNSDSDTVHAVVKPNYRRMSSVKVGRSVGEVATQQARREGLIPRRESEIKIGNRKEE